MTSLPQKPCKRCGRAMRNTPGRTLCDGCRVAADGLGDRDNPFGNLYGSGTGRTSWERHAADSGLDGWAARQDAAGRSAR